MKLKLKVIIDSANSLLTLTTAECKEAKARYWLSKLDRKFRKVHSDISEQNKEIAKKYGTYKEGKFNFNDPIEKNKEDFEKEIKDFLETEDEFDLPTVQYKYTTYSNITPAQLGELHWIVEEPTSEELE